MTSPSPETPRLTQFYDPNFGHLRHGQLDLGVPLDRNGAVIVHGGGAESKSRLYLDIDESGVQMHLADNQPLQVNVSSPEGPGRVYVFSEPIGFLALQRITLETWAAPLEGVRTYGGIEKFARAVGEFARVKQNNLDAGRQR